MRACQLGLLGGAQLDAAHLSPLLLVLVQCCTELDTAVAHLPVQGL